MADPEVREAQRQIALKAAKSAGKKLHVRKPPAMRKPRRKQRDEAHWNAVFARLVKPSYYDGTLHEKQWRAEHARSMGKEKS